MSAPEIGARGTVEICGNLEGMVTEIQGECVEGIQGLQSKDSGQQAHPAP